MPNNYAWKPVEFYKEISPYPLQCYGSTNEIHERFINKAFEVHWTARTNIKKLDDKIRRDAMLKTLEEVSDSGGWDFPPLEPTSLNQAFKEVAKYSRWYCTTPGSFAPKDYPYWDTDTDLRLLGNRSPKAAANFFKAFDEKLADGEKAHESLWEQLKIVAEVAKSSIERPSRDQAHKAEQAMKIIKEAHEKAEQYVWWTTKAVDVTATMVYAWTKETSRLSKMMEIVEKCSEGSEGLTSAVSKALWVFEKPDEIKDRFESMQGSLGRGAAATLALLPEVLEYVPVFGKLYAEAFKGVPQLVDMLEERNRQLQLAMATCSR